MTPELRKALSDWLKWAENGAPDNECFYRGFGLCVAVAFTGGMPLGEELEAIFAAQGLGRSHPFGKKAYNEGFDNKTMHLDPNRLAWVRAQLEGEG